MGLPTWATSEMVNRQRKQGEERSGGVLPLIPPIGADSRAAPLTLPSLTGARPTFREFVGAYPSLKEVQIKKAIMTK